MAATVGIESDPSVSTTPGAAAVLSLHSLVRLTRKRVEPVQSYETIVVAGASENFDYVKSHQSYRQVTETVIGTVKHVSMGVVQEEAGKDEDGKTVYADCPVQVLSIGAKVVRTAVDGTLLAEESCERVVYAGDPAYNWEVFSPGTEIPAQAQAE